MDRVRIVAWLAVAAAVCACGPAATGASRTAARPQPAVYCLDLDRWPDVFTRNAVIARGVLVPARAAAAPSPDDEGAGYMVTACEFEPE